MNKEQAEILEQELSKMVSVLLGYTSAVPGLENITVTGIQFEAISEQREEMDTLKSEEMDAFFQERTTAEVVTESTTVFGNRPLGFNSPLFGPRRRCVGPNGVFFVPAFQQCPPR